MAPVCESRSLGNANGHNRATSYLLISIVAAILAAGCDEPAAVCSQGLDWDWTPRTYELAIGAVFTIHTSATCDGRDITPPEMLWRSSDTTIVVVDRAARVTAVGKGDTTVTGTDVSSDSAPPITVTVHVYDQSTTVKLKSPVLR